MQASRTKFFLSLITALCIGLPPTAYACTRAVYVGQQQLVLTGRSMDWSTDIGTNIWMFPRGMQREGAAGPNSIKWQSKYGSVIATFFDVATVDGLNEKGLVANVLYLAESVYPTIAKDDKHKTISIAAWAQYVLDNFATVNEVVAELSKQPFYVQGVMTPDGHPGTGHLSISDPTGDSAIFEYIDGKLIIDHDPKYKVMTNSPTFDQQLAINNYWTQIGGAAMLPGTARAADRFVRAAYYNSTLPQTSDVVAAVAGVFSVIANASAPYGVAAPGQPNIATTLWRTVSDSKSLRYYYQSTSSPNTFWVDFADLDFAAKQSKKLEIIAGQVYAGNTAKQFKETAPFVFLAAKAS